MWHESRSRQDQRGFSLIEALISLSIMVVILLGAGQLMFSTKRSADRMAQNSEARSIARRALEYLSFHARNAADLNGEFGNPMAVMIFYNKGGNSLQATFNNVNPATDGNIADAGTDIISVGVPNSSLTILNDKWPGGDFQAANTNWRFTMGCPDSALNDQLFKEFTGYNPDTGMSGPIPIWDANGQFDIFQITDYKASDCTKPEASGFISVHIVNNSGLSDGYNEPSGWSGLGVADPVHMGGGVVFISFRVHNGWLEQKNGLFDPMTDNPGTEFVPILPNVEDLQIAWVFRDGTVWNDAAAHRLDTGTYPGSVPTQEPAASRPAYDVTNVVGLRISVTAHSTDVVFRPSKPLRRPAVEDGPAGTSIDNRYHEVMTDLAMIRNRNLTM